MKRLLLVSLLVILVASGCSHLFFNNSNGPTPEARQELQALLNSVSFEPYANKKSIFDCSNATAVLFDFLSSHGYQSKIMTGMGLEISKNSIFVFHAWLIVEKNGVKFWIESWNKEIVPPAYFNKYFLRLSFNSIEDAKEWSDFLGIGDEWNY